MLLAVAALVSLAGAGMASAAGGTLTPTPPNSLPAHKPAVHHRTVPAQGHQGGAKSGLANTGIDAQLEVAVALLLLGCGAFAKAFCGAPPGLRDRRR
jgi:hypothetical protein